MIKKAKKVSVYLPAEKCSAGVMEAIQSKLHGAANDQNFLKKLIYSGAIDIYIDGLNEVSAETRAGIVQFVESNFRGNIIMTSQPLEWTPPATASTWILKALSTEQMEAFLLLAGHGLPENSIVTGQAYEQACTQFLDRTLHEDQSPEELESIRSILSNPMDLTVVAHLLASGKEPDAFNLQQQQFKIMAADYKTKHLQDFPLHLFAEQVYQMRLNDESKLTQTRFSNEFQTMERYKMMLRRQSVDVEGKPSSEWHFRHDKIMEFFIVQLFLGVNNDLPKKHLGDPRFRGVYFLLASMLPMEAAMALRERIIRHAADTKDHTVSDTFVQLLVSREAISE